jgi:holo-[acyl-carrier protein] synthase
MIHAVGLDLVEIARVQRDIEKYGERFVDRILGPAERALYDNRIDKDRFLAGRFAAKEAVVKALGFRLAERPSWNKLQVLNDPTGQPVCHFPERLRDQLADVSCLVSITHEKTHAAAVAIIQEVS